MRLTDPTADDPFNVALDAEGLKRSSVRGGLLIGVTQAFRVVLQIGSQVILARLLFPAEFGLMAMVYPLVSFLQIFTDLGLGEIIVQRPTLQKDRVSTLFWINIGLSVGIALVIALISPVAAWIYGEPRVTGLMIALGALLPVTALGGVQGALLTRQMRFPILVRNELVATTAGILVTIGTAWAGWSYWSLVAGQLVSTVISAGLNWSACTWRPLRPAFAPEAWADLRFGGNLAAVSLATFATTSGPNIIIGALSGRVALGLYDRSYRLVVQPVGQIMSPISRVSVPLLSRLNGQPDEYRSTFLNVIKATALLTLPGILMCVVNGDLVIRVMLGERWREAGPVFAWICVGGLASALYSSTAWLFISQAKMTEMRRFTVWTAPINVGSYAIGAIWGIVGVAMVSSLFFLLVVTPIVVYGATRVGPVSPRDIIRCCAPLVAEGLIVYFILLAFAEMALLSGLAMIVAAGLLSYGIFFLLTALLPSERPIFRVALSAFRMTLAKPAA